MSDWVLHPGTYSLSTRTAVIVSWDELHGFKFIPSCRPSGSNNFTWWAIRTSSCLFGVGYPHQQLLQCLKRSPLCNRLLQLLHLRVTAGTRLISTPRLKLSSPT